MLAKWMLLVPCMCLSGGGGLRVLSYSMWKCALAEQELLYSQRTAIRPKCSKHLKNGIFFDLYCNCHQLTLFYYLFFFFLVGVYFQNALLLGFDFLSVLSVTKMRLEYFLTCLSFISKVTLPGSEPFQSIWKFWTMVEE